MKLSFSTKGWHEGTFADFCAIAEDLKYEGIELHNIHNRLFTAKDGAFHDYAAAATLRGLREKGLTLSCLDAITDLSDPEAREDNRKEILACLDIAENLKIPYVRVKAKAAEDEEAATAEVYHFNSNIC